VAIDPPTVGLEAVFEAGSSLVFVCYDDRGHRMVNPVETTLISALTAAIGPSSTRPDGGTAEPLGEFVPTASDHAGVPVRVYPSTIAPEDAY
jgi:hypothetical protein